MLIYCAAYRFALFGLFISSTGIAYHHQQWEGRGSGTSLLDCISIYIVSELQVGGGGEQYEVNTLRTALPSPLDGGRSIYKTIGRGGPWKLRHFRALKCQRANVMYIKLPMYLFLYMALGLLMGANSLLGPLEGVGTENLDFLGLKWHSLCSLPKRVPFEPKKVSIFRANPFQSPL